MDTLPDVSPVPFQKTVEKTLGWGALALLEIHMVLCPYREVLADYRCIQKAERWFGLFLLVSALLYLVITAVRFPQSRCRFRTFFRRLLSFEQLYLVGLFFWYLFTVLLRQVLIGRVYGGNYFADNDWWMFITALMAFIMFPMSRVLGGENMKRVFNPMLKLALLPHLVFYSWALWQYFHMNEVVFPSGTTLHMMQYSMEIGVNRNSVGAYGVTMMTMCLYLAAVEKGWRKIPYLFGTAVYTAVLILSNCRTSWYTAVLVIAAAGFLWTWTSLNEKHVLIRIGSGILISAAGVLLLQWLRSELFTLLDAAITRAAIATEPAAPAVAAFSSHDLSAVPLVSSHIPSAIPLSPGINQYARYYTTGLSGRMKVYRACLYVMFHSKYCFLFGVTPTDVGPSLYRICEVWDVFPHAHNFFLQIGMCFGVPCMLITIAFVISLMIRSIRLLFSKNRVLLPGFWMIPVVVMCMLSQDMMEAFLNSGGTLVCVFFYVFSGWITAIDNEQKESEIRRNGVVSKQQKQLN
ncbi:MAG: O-antigen ligase family protein [Oscillospiraceae bacterium]|nr:O-antigen ligase family protein [Oscillospiraceae bacterium]